MNELGRRIGDGQGDEPATDPCGAEPVLPETARFTEYRRVRNAALGGEGEKQPAPSVFATRLARAVAEAGRANSARATDGPRSGSLPVLREAVFGDGPIAETLELPEPPTAVCDAFGRIVRANPALVALVGDRVELFGMRLDRLAIGPDTDALVVRADEGTARVRVVRVPLPDTELSIVVLVERTARDARPDARTDGWIAELERLAKVGMWSMELSVGELTRSGSLEELYRSCGVDPLVGVPTLEDDLVAALYQELRDGERGGDRYAELRLAGDRVLSCRAEVEYTPDGAPLRLVGVVRDVSNHRLSDARVQQAARRFADLMSLVPGGVAVIDSGGVVVDASTELATLLRYPLDQLRGLPAAELAADSIGEPLAGSLPGWLRPVPPGARYGYRLEEVPIRRGDGITVWCELAVSTTASDDGSWFWLVVCTDTSERRQAAQAAEQLRHVGSVDELTRLPNRAAILELLDRHLAGPGRDRVAVLCGNLDDFQRVNSSLGHEAGDGLLVQLAGQLQRELPAGCTAARLGGDEFVVICADHLAVGGADQFARVVAELLRTTITVQGRPVVITASVGVATSVPSGEVRAADLLRFAEVAMHDAKKRQCRGAIGLATDGVVDSATRALEIEAELRAAIADDGLTLEYQPVVGPDGTVRSAEALVRWPHPERGMVSPGDFLPVAQRSGLLRELDLWVLRTAAQEAAGWPVAADGRPPAVAVNLAGLLPGDPDFLTTVTDIVDETGLAWDRLVLELVETSLVALAPHALAAMGELAARGVRFAVDDFGTGYSSLARLKTLPAQVVKVDRAFVTGIADDPADFAVARAVVDMAKAMNRTTVAEGVETAEQFHVLRGIGVDAYQGWLFSRSLPPADLHVVLAGGRLATPASALLI